MLTAQDVRDESFSYSDLLLYSILLYPPLLSLSVPVSVSVSLEVCSRQLAKGGRNLRDLLRETAEQRKEEENSFSATEKRD